ncbi:MAG: ATP-binding cassette domain-containing protein [Chloroflexota bacterium]
MDAIVTQALTKIYRGGVKAVDQVSFEVERGEIFGFVGPHGAGKTTTMKILNTLLRPTGGRAEVNGYDVVKTSAEVRKSIGYVAQEIGVDELATGKENLTLYGHLYHLGSGTVKRRVGELLDLVGLRGRENKLVSTYSGGMRKRLDIAMGLIHHPKILFLDEPTAGHDPQTRTHIWDYIRELSQEEGVTIFFTTHYMDEAEKLAHRIAIIDYGKIVALGTPDELKRQISGDVVTVQLEPRGPEKADDTLQRGLAIVKVLPFVHQIQPRNGDLNVYVERGDSAVPQLVRTLEGHDITVKTISLARPSLDDVFLKYTGRSIREETGERTSWAKMGRERRRRQP